MNNLLNLLSNDKFWVVISSVSGAVAAIAAMIAVYQSRASAKDERTSKRPYFTISTPGIKPLPESPPFRIMITMENIGTHPAINMSAKILFVESSLSQPASFVFDFSIANEVPVKTPTPWYNDSLRLPANVSSHFIVTAIKYQDPILRKYFVQTFFMKWDGVNNGITHPDFVHTSLEEKLKVEKYLRKILEEFGSRQIKLFNQIEIRRRIK